MIIEKWNYEETKTPCQFNSFYFNSILILQLQLKLRKQQVLINAITFCIGMR